MGTLGRCSFASACGAVGFGVAASMKKTFQPGGMAYYKVTRPMFTPIQRVSVALAAVAGGLVVEDHLGLARAEHTLGRMIRASARPILRVTDSMRNKWRTGQERREREEQREWGRQHTSAARIY